MAEYWFVQLDGRQIGPLSSAELKLLASGGAVAHDTLLKQGDNGKWVPARYVKNLFKADKEQTDAKPSNPPPAAGAQPSEPASESPGEESPLTQLTATGTSESSISSSGHVLTDSSSAERDTNKQSPGVTRKTQELAEGSFLGDCIIAEQLGVGAMGVVFKAEHVKLKKTVAVKILRSAAVENDMAIRRFHQEVRAAKMLSHPNIVAAYEDGEVRGMHYLVMEYIDGETLAEVVGRWGPLPVGLAVDYMMQAARGLEYAHGMGVIHRDIKPGNLLLTRDGVVKILDMGLARLDETGDAIREATSFEALTTAHQVMGTLDYMAPEQAADARQADQRADIYSLGCTIYRLLTGKPIFGGETIINKIVAHRDHAIPSLRKQRPDVSSELDAVYHKMVSKRREDRYESMTDVLSDLNICQSGTAGDLLASQIMVDDEASPDSAIVRGGGPMVEMQLTQEAPLVIQPSSGQGDSYKIAANEEPQRRAPSVSDIVAVMIFKLGHHDPGVRERMVESLRNLGAEAVPSLIKSLHAEEPVYSGAAMALSRIGAGAVPALIAALGDEDNKVRQAATWVLGRIGQPALPALIEALWTDRRRRNAAIIAIARMGPEAASAADELRKLMASKKLSDIEKATIRNTLRRIE